MSRVCKIIFISLSLVFSLSLWCESRVLTQLTPSLTVSGEYRSNYFNTTTDKTDEYISTYQLGFSMAFLERTHQVYLSYRPAYKDYDRFDEKDALDHAVTLDGKFQPSKHTLIDAHLGYDGHSQEETGGSSSHEASIQATHQLFKHTLLFLTQDYSKSYDQKIRTGEYKEHDVSTTTTGLSYQFGKSNTFSFDYSFIFDDYNDLDADEYQTHQFSSDLSFGLTPFWGINMGASIEDTDYQYDIDDPQTLSGYIRLSRKINRHLDYYVKYSHTLTDKLSGNHEVYHPAIGIDWQPTEDSGVNIAAGILFEQWEAYPESDGNNLFVDLDVYKDFHFSPRGTFTIEAGSGYSQTAPGAASLGFNRYYEAGMSLRYQLTRRLTYNLGMDYKLSRYDNPQFNRRDDTFEGSAGLGWNPMKWMNVDLSYGYTDFKTNDQLRDDYNNHTIMLSITFTPEKPLKMEN